VLDILREFGYLFVFIGTFVEGETTLVMAGILVREGSLSFSGVVLISLLASYLGHISCYFLGYYGGSPLLKKFPRLENKVFRIYFFIRRYATPGVFLAQYILGLRLASAVAFGLAGMRPLTYIVLQGISCLIWACLFTLLGVLFGYSAEEVIKDLEKVLVLVLILGLVLFWIVKKGLERWLRGPA
jgi:membrane protein DedA with SNARE-associated domain